MTKNEIKILSTATVIGYCLMAMVACADNDMEQLSVREPETLTAYDYLKDYDVLRSYDSKVGVVMDAGTFFEKGMEYRIAVANFGQIVPGLAFCHQQVVRISGAIDTQSITKMLALTAQQDLTLVGTPLISHQNQNTTYLNARLSPHVIRPEGDDGGYSLKMTNSSVVALTDAQVAYTFAKTPQVEPGIKYKLTMMVRGTAEGTVQVATYSNGKGSRFNPNITVTKEWQQVSLQTTMASGIKGLTSILFNLGQYVGTIYVDDIALYEVDNRGDEVTDNLNTQNADLDDAEQTAASVAVLTNTENSIEEAGVSALGEGYDPLATYVEKTDEEKRDILTAEMQRYLSGVMTLGDGRINDWVVVSDPLAEDTGEDATAFFWQHYLGTDYAATAFKQAASLTSGRLYIGAGELDSPEKTTKLIQYVNRMETLGSRIDGIALSVHSNTSATTDYGQIFQLLAATGKHIMISDLSVDIDDTSEVTEQQLKQQAYCLSVILQAYTSQVPKAQRGGIIWHQVLDGVEPLGLWNQKYNRKHVYGSFANGLKAE